LQDRAALERLLDATMAAAGRLARKPPVLLKIAPDLDEAALTDIAAVVRSQGADGIIATNTTVARPNSLRGLNGREAGGLSGAPLFAPSTAILTQLRAIAGPRMLLIGVGGVASGHDALAKIKAGASLVQLYSALAYEGPGLIQRIVRELTALVKAEGYASLSDMLRARDGQ
jgi:dihydroorotate dehydrogenase